MQILPWKYPIKGRKNGGGLKRYGSNLEKFKNTESHHITKEEGYSVAIESTSHEGPDLSPIICLACKFLTSNQRTQLMQRFVYAQRV